MKVKYFTMFAALLFGVWILLNGWQDVSALIAGAVISLVIAALFSASAGPLFAVKLSPQALWAIVCFFIFFVKEMIKANLQVAAVVLNPALPLKPAIVAVKTRLQTPMGRLLLANSITLTPGTLTVDIKEDTLYIHWISAETTDTAAATKVIVEGFERYIEVFYG